MNYKGSIHTGGQSNHGLESEGGVNEIAARNDHEIMAKHIADKLATDLNIGYGDRTFVERLLFSSIKEMVRDLLREYENVVADKIHDTVKSNLEYEYKVELDSKPDYSHAAHAKLSTLMKEVKEKLITKEEK
jgi:hypothetical protein